MQKTLLQGLNKQNVTNHLVEDEDMFERRLSFPGSLSYETFIELTFLLFSRVYILDFPIHRYQKGVWRRN